MWCGLTADDIDYVVAVRDRRGEPLEHQSRHRLARRDPVRALVEGHAAPGLGEHPQARQLLVHAGGEQQVHGARER
jgi:hypothetical protein